MASHRSMITDIVIETPKGARNKYVFDPERNAFRLKKILPAGAVFPFDFGFIPGTLGADGDPLDVLVIMDEPAYPGCLVPSRIIGVLKARQSEEGKLLQNDRLIAVSVDSNMYQELKEITDLDKNIRKEIQHFFISYNEQAGKKFLPEGWAGAAAAAAMIRRQQTDAPPAKRRKK